MNVATRLSPMHEALEHLDARLESVRGMPTAIHFGDPQSDAAKARALAICDVSCPPRIGVKGAGAAAWLASLGIEIPSGIYDHLPLSYPRGCETSTTHQTDRHPERTREGSGLERSRPDASRSTAQHDSFIRDLRDGLIVRTGTAEFFVEDTTSSDWVSRLWSADIGAPQPIYRFHRQDAAMILSGERTLQVMQQTCGYNFAAPDRDFVMTRVAGVSCSILRDDDQTNMLRIWCDGSYGMYLFETLLKIVRELGGDVVGMGWLFPDLLK